MNKKEIERNKINDVENEEDEEEEVELELERELELELEVEENNCKDHYPEQYTTSAFKKQLDCQLVDIYTSLDSTIENQIYYNKMHKSRTSTSTSSSSPGPKENIKNKKNIDEKKILRQVENKIDWAVEIEKERSRHRDKEKEMEKELERHKERAKNREKEIEMEKNRMRERERERERAKEVQEKREKEKERDERDRERREDRERELERQKEKEKVQEIEWRREKEKNIEEEIQREQKYLHQLNQNQKEIFNKGSTSIDLTQSRLKYDREHYSDIRLIADHYSNSSDTYNDGYNDHTIDHTNINIGSKVYTGYRSACSGEPNRRVANALNFDSQILPQPPSKYSSEYDSEGDIDGDHDGDNDGDGEEAATGAQLNFFEDPSPSSQDWGSRPPRDQVEDEDMRVGIGMGTGYEDSSKPYSSTASSRSRNRSSAESRINGTTPSSSSSSMQHTHAQHTQHIQHVFQQPLRGSEQPTHVRMTRTFSKEESDNPRICGPSSVMSDIDDRTVWAASPSPSPSLSLVRRSGTGDRARPVRTDSPSLINRRRGSSDSYMSSNSYLDGTYVHVMLSCRISPLLSVMIKSLMRLDNKE